jgi:cell division protein FtsI/penicillin-binding protein 2
VEKYAEKDVFDYNIGLGALLTLAKKLIAHRIANIELRRS